MFKEIKRRVTIRQVIEGSGVKVNNKGQFICPFHNDKHPSASIKNDFFHCFVCGAGGDCITYTAKMYGLSNYEACKRLNEEYRLGIEYGQKLSRAEKAAVKEANEQREKEQAEREEIEQLIKRTGDILADCHRVLHFWQFEEPGSMKYQFSAMELPTIKYYLECYDEEPKKFSLEMKEEVERVEVILKCLRKC